MPLACLFLRCSFRLSELSALTHLLSSKQTNIMGKPRIKRTDRPSKRKYYGNQHSESTRKANMIKGEAVSDPDSRDVGETSNQNNTHVCSDFLPPTPSSTSYLKTSASFAKLKQQDVEFD